MAFPAVVVEISTEFKQWVLNSYTNKPYWTRISEKIDENSNLNEVNRMDYPYKKIWNLIYYDDLKLGPRLCIPLSLEGEVFQKAYNNLGHSEYT